MTLPLPPPTHTCVGAKEIGLGEGVWTAGATLVHALLCARTGLGAATDTIKVAENVGIRRATRVL